MRVGVDVIEIARLARTIRKYPSFLARVYSDRELRIADSFQGSRRDSFLAGRFAVKEAVAKALRIGIEPTARLTDIEVLRDDNGVPRLCLHGRFQEIADEQGIGEYDVSISHDGGVAVGFAVLSMGQREEDNA